MTEDKCLVSEAREKCQCSWCKQVREWDKLSLEAIYRWEAYKTWRDCFEKATKEKKWQQR